jgi:hypothetical protein
MHESRSQALPIRVTALTHKGCTRIVNAETSTDRINDLITALLGGTPFPLSPPRGPPPPLPLKEAPLAQMS